jgi:hypothetical protein
LARSRGCIVVGVLEARRAPGFDEVSLAHDIGVLLLAEPTRASSWPIRKAPLNDTAVGQSLRLVGFGATSASPMPSAPVKREGTTLLAGFDALTFHYDAARHSRASEIRAGQRSLARASSKSSWASHPTAMCSAAITPSRRGSTWRPRIHRTLHRRDNGRPVARPCVRGGAAGWHGELRGGCHTGARLEAGGTAPIRCARRRARASAAAAQRSAAACTARARGRIASLLTSAEALTRGRARSGCRFR